MSDIETRQKKLPVLLFIRGEQYFDDVDPDATELTTEGTLELTEKGLLLTYQGDSPHRHGGDDHHL